MLKVKTALRSGKLLLGVLLVVSLAGPALADEVWSWRTEDGTFAFTDDPKRIPARYRGDARSRPLGELSRYERFTRVSPESEKAYADRVRARLSELRGAIAAAPNGAVAGAAVTSTPDVFYGLPASGGRGRGGAGASYIVPLASDRNGSDDEPTTIESIRVKPRDSLASRHWTVVKKGDKIVTVIKGEKRQRPLDGPSESDFDL